MLALQPPAFAVGGCAPRPSQDIEVGAKGEISVDPDPEGMLWPAGA